MQSKWIGATVLFGAVSLACAATSNAEVDNVELTLSGCVVSGEAKDSFLLTNVQIEGSSLAPSHAFYRFNTSKGLKDHVGRRVEVKGKADLGDVDKGQLRVRTEDGKVTTELRSERKTVKVEDVRFGSLGSMKVDADVPTYKFEVASVKRLEGDCSSTMPVP